MPDSCATDCSAVSELRDEMKTLRRDLTAQHIELTRLMNTVLHHVVGQGGGAVNVTVGGAHIENSNSQGKAGNGLADAAGKLLNGVLS